MDKKRDKVVKDLFIENEFKTINDVRNTLDCKANYICEYKIIKSIFKNLIEKLKHHANFINIKNKRTFLFFNSNYHILKAKCKIFYDILLKSKFLPPLYQKLFKNKYKTNQEDWKQIYTQKIKLALDRNIAEFNYKLLNNTLCCKQMLYKWRKVQNGNCVLCNETEDIEHLIFKCKNVHNTWKIVSLVINFDIKWKDILIGFHHENNRKIQLLNNISFVALKI